MRLPAISSRSSRSPRKARPGATSTSIDKVLVGMHALQHAREIVQHGRDFGAAAQHVERAGGAGPREIVIDLPAHGGDLARHRLGERSRTMPAASLASTVSGVFRKCARLATWARARPTTSALCAIRLLSSPASGAIFGGKFALQPPGAPLADARQRFADAAQRHQPDPHLNRDGRKQAQAERGKAPEQSPVEARDIGFHLSDRSPATRKRKGAPGLRILPRCAAARCGGRERASAGGRARRHNPRACCFRRARGFRGRESDPTASARSGAAYPGSAACRARSANTSRRTRARSADRRNGPAASHARAHRLRPRRPGRRDRRRADRPCSPGRRREKFRTARTRRPRGTARSTPPRRQSAGR